RLSRLVAATPSAQYSLTLRVEIEHRPGMLGRVASAIGEAGGPIGGGDLGLGGGGSTMPATPGGKGEGSARAAVSGGGGRGAAVAGRGHHGPDVLAARRGQDRDPEQEPAEDAGRPLDGVHAGGGAGVPGHS